MTASLDVIIKQMILSAFRSAQMTSASPGHINHFIGIESQGGLDIIGSEQEINDAIVAMVTSAMEGNSTESLPEDLIEGSSKEKKKGTNEKQAATLINSSIGAANNPASIVAAGIPFLPHAALVILAAALVPLVFDELTRPGGIIDLRFKRYVTEEVTAFLSRQSQKDTEMGTRQVIVQSKKGFTASNGVNNYNTVRGIREGGLDKERLDRIGMVDHSKGVFD